MSYVYKRFCTRGIQDFIIYGRDVQETLLANNSFNIIYIRLNIITSYYNTHRSQATQNLCVTIIIIYSFTFLHYRMHGSYRYTEESYRNNIIYIY